MNILVVSATDFEITPLVRKLEFIAVLSENLKHYKSDFNEVDILITGVGIPFTIYHLTRVLNKHEYDIVINAGIAGSFKNSIEIGAVTNVVTDQFADIGIEDHGNFKSIFEINLHDKNMFPFVDAKLENNTHVSNKVISDLKKVSAVSVNMVSGSNKTIDFMKNIYNPDIETMEGAAFVYVCMMSKIKYFQIRSISNFVEERNVKNWNIKLAVSNLNEKIIQLVNIDFLIK